MTNPTPISTASSSDDLVEQLRQVSLTIIGAQPQAEWVSALISMAASEIERLRQPVAGDVVEREKHIGWLREQIKPCAIEMKPGGTEIYMMFITSDRAEKFFEKLQDALFDMPFKLIGGGK